MDPVSCVSCVSLRYSVNAAETHETENWESGMRYHAHTTISSGDRGEERPLYLVVFAPPALTAILDSPSDTM
jgi:hypothetical protein